MARYSGRVVVPVQWLTAGIPRATLPDGAQNYFTRQLNKSSETETHQIWTAGNSNPDIVLSPSNFAVLKEGLKDIFLQGQVGPASKYLLVYNMSLSSYLTQSHGQRSVTVAAFISEDAARHPVLECAGFTVTDRDNFSDLVVSAIEELTADQSS